MLVPLALTGFAAVVTFACAVRGINKALTPDGTYLSAILAVSSLIVLLLTIAVACFAEW